jgi:hypothetical protein
MMLIKYNILVKKDLISLLRENSLHHGRVRNRYLVFRTVVDGVVDLASYKIDLFIPNSKKTNHLADFK